MNIPPTRRLQKRPMQRAVRGQSVRAQIIDVVLGDGRTVTLHSNCEPLFDEEGQTRGAVGTFLDITELKRIEAALRASEQRFRAIVQAVPSLTFESDPDGGNTFASESWCTFTGLTLAQTLGYGWTRVLHPDDLTAVTERWAEAMRHGTRFESQHRIRCRRWYVPLVYQSRPASPKRQGTDRTLGGFAHRNRRTGPG